MGVSGSVPQTPRHRVILKKSVGVEGGKDYGKKPRKN